MSKVIKSEEVKIAARQIDVEALKEQVQEPPISELDAAVNGFIQARLDEYTGDMDDEERVSGYLSELRAQLNGVIKAAVEEVNKGEGEEISVYYPEQSFSPIPYMSYRCGNLWYKTIVLPGETRDEAYDRAFAYVRKLVEQQFLAARQDFHSRVANMSV